VQEYLGVAIDFLLPKQYEANIMDIISIVFLVIGGGLGALIGTQIAKRISNKNTRVIAIVIPVVVLGQMAGYLSDSSFVRDRIDPPSQFQRLSRESFSSVVDSEAFKTAINGKTPEEVRAFARQQGQLGIKRLSHAELMEWNRLRVLVAEKSESVCAGFWTGQMPGQELVDALNTIPESDCRSWVDVVATAALAAINDEPFQEPPSTAFQAGVQEIAAKLSPADKARLDRALANDQAPTNDEACWTALTLLRGANELESHQQEQFLRALASAMI
jgi:hypothetical protein